MNTQFDSSRESSHSPTRWRKLASLSWGKLTKNLVQSVTRRAALKKFGLACIAAVLISASIPARADATVPFNGVVTGQIPPDFFTQVVPGDPTGCLLHFMVSNAGIGTELGAFTGRSEFLPSLCDLNYTGFFYWTAANGDQIYGAFQGHLEYLGPGQRFRNVETAQVTGGTGRFAGATGATTLTGEVNFDTLSFLLPWQGTISIPGLNKKP